MNVIKKKKKKRIKKKKKSKKRMFHDMSISFSQEEDPSSDDTH